ncbi:hypothetical protein [Aeromicrobium sp. CTD01-1L150]|uniref:hypothetical protein n=1 Tax=Aeromicrobium sp. CTD01-1L150 TaxID=3341830 RepID=UPI0035BF1D12
MSRQIRVTSLKGRDTTWVAGYGSRELIVTCGGKPMWSNRQRAWMTSRKVGADVVAMAERDGYDVSLELVSR